MLVGEPQKSGGERSGKLKEYAILLYMYTQSEYLHSPITCSEFCSTRETVYIFLSLLDVHLLALLVPGTNGHVEQSYLTKQNLGTSGISKYPLDLIEVMTRFGEDRIWANDIHMAESILNFVVTLTQEREDAAAIRKCKFSA